MDVYDLQRTDIRPHQPVVVASRPEGRAVALELPAGESLSDHEVHERAWVVVVDGLVEFDAAGGPVEAGRGTLAVFDPGERHAVRAIQDTRLLMLLSPWPGVGHPGTRDGVAAT